MTLNGIDISNWQKTIDPAAISADFTICKATEGTGFVDPQLGRFANATIALGRGLGLYHFATGRSTVEAEADAFIAAAKPYIGRAILVLDWEAGVVSKGVGWAKRWLDRVRVATGITPLIYMSASVTRANDWNMVAPYYPLWVAAYGADRPIADYQPPAIPSVGHWQAPTIFQYSQRGSLKGYAGALDLDLYLGTRSDWDRLTGPNQVAAPDVAAGSVFPLPPGHFLGPRRLAGSLNGIHTTGPEVRNWQQRVMDLGVTTVRVGEASRQMAVDGDFRDITEAATREAQRKLGFAGKDIDGLVGINTWQRAFAAS